MSKPTGEYISLVIQLASTADGTWRISVYTLNSIRELPLRPVTLVVRLWRNEDSHVLRGTITHSQTAAVAPFQTNSQLQQIIGDWLLPDNSAINRP